MNDRLILAAIVVGVVLVRSTSAQTINLQNGAKIEGEIVALEEGKVKLKLSGGGELFLSRSEIAPEEEYRLRRREMEDAPQAHFELALYCLGNNLFLQAKEELIKAGELDPEFKKEEVAKLLSQIEVKIANANALEARREKFRGLLRFKNHGRGSGEIDQRHKEKLIASDLERGREYLEKKKYRRAITSFERVLFVDPGNQEAKEGIAKAEAEKEKQKVNRLHRQKGQQ